MTKTPPVLTQTPTCSILGESDLLSDLLGSMHLSGGVLLRTECREPWSLDTPDAREMACILPFRTEHIIPFHIVAEGGCWLEMPDRERTWLATGDAVLLPYGDRHRLAGRQHTDKSVPVVSLLVPPPWEAIQVLRHGGKGSLTRLICGFMQCDELLFHPILRHLPPLLHVSPASDPADLWLANTVRYADYEASHTRPGARSMLARLSELMFVEVLRKHMQTLSADKLGWFAALNDPVAGAALKWLHTAPSDYWDVDRLANRVGASRSVLAVRFKHFLGQPPMQYLSHWRLQLAAQALKATDSPLKRIADQTGYESEAAFSRAFKRHFGLPPADWRKRQTLAVG